MANANYRNAGIQVSDVLLLGALAVGGYFVYKAVVKPTSQVTGAVGNVTDAVGDSSSNIITGLGNIWSSALNQVKKGIQAIGSGKSNMDSFTPTKTVSISGGHDYVSKVENTTIYGNKGVNVSMNSGSSTTIAATPNTYNPNVGIGFDSKGNGYSSMTPLKR